MTTITRSLVDSVQFFTMDDPVLKSGVAKLSALGEEAGFTIEEMIRILNCGFTVEQLLEVIQIQLDKQRKDRESLLRKSG